MTAPTSTDVALVEPDVEHPPRPIDDPPTAASERAARWLAAHSITGLRISLGLVFLTFGSFKFVPGASPAQELAIRTIDTLSFGIVSGQTALLLTAVAETLIGLTLATGRFVRVGLVLLAASMVGIMSPLVLFFSELVPGTPTLEAQYVFKDIVLVAAGLVVAAHTVGPSDPRPGGDEFRSA